MRAITLHQPWASLIAIGAKPFETRNYPPPAKLIGQRIAIHAAVKPARFTMRGLNQPTFFAIREALSKGGYRFDLVSDLEALPHGAVVATAVLAGAGKVMGIDDGIPYFAPGIIHLLDRRGDIPPTINLDHFGDYSPGRWAWLLTDVQHLTEPVPAKGRQGWWFWEPPAREVA